MDSSLRITDAGLISLSPDDIYGPRRPDGRLPVIKFLHLKQNSVLVHAGESTELASKYNDNGSDSNNDIGEFPSKNNQDNSGKIKAWLKVFLIIVAFVKLFLTEEIYSWIISY